MEPAPSCACFPLCKTKGLDEMISNISSCSTIFMRPDIQLNNSSQTGPFRPSSDTSPNIQSRASSHLQTFLDFFIRELIDNSSSINTEALHPQILNVKNMTMSIHTVTKITLAFTPSKTTAKGTVVTSSTARAFCSQYRNVATRGHCPESIIIKKKPKNSFWCFPS